MDDVSKPLEPVLSPEWVKQRIEHNELRLRIAKVSLAEVGRKAGVSASTWQRWRSGENSPRIDNLHAIEEQVDKAVTAALSTN